MSDKLSGAKSLRFEARSMVPVKSPTGLWVSLFGTARVVKEGAGKLFAETRGDLFPYDFYFDGKTVTAYTPAKNLYAEKSAPGTVDDVIEAFDAATVAVNLRMGALIDAAEVSRGI
jgi:hypothetical protein